MAEYIEREALLLRIDCYGTNKFGMLDEDIRAFVKAQPAADVAPVVHGQWILGTVEPGYLTPGGNRPWICSECKQVISWSLGRPYENYCHNCGAKMDGGGTDEAD